MKNRIGGSSILLTASSKRSTGFVRALASINNKYNQERYKNLPFFEKKEKKLWT